MIYLVWLYVIAAASPTGEANGAGGGEIRTGPGDRLDR